MDAFYRASPAHGGGASNLLLARRQRRFSGASAARRQRRHGISSLCGISGAAAAAWVARIAARARGINNAHQRDAISA